MAHGLKQLQPCIDPKLLRPRLTTEQFETLNEAVQAAKAGSDIALRFDTMDDVAVAIKAFVHIAPLPVFTFKTHEVMVEIGDGCIFLTSKQTGVGRGTALLQERWRKEQKQRSTQP